MVIKRASMRSLESHSSHGGNGRLVYTEMLAEHGKKGPGLTFFADSILEPGTTIGEHEHNGNEEAYIILEGHGTMIVDGEHHEAGPGDLIITRSGHSHGFINSTDSPMRMIVVCTIV